MTGPAILGLADGQPTLTANGPAPALSSSQDALPELEEAVQAARPMWRHPAFLVSAILTVLALIAAGVFGALALFGTPDNRIETLAISVSSDNAHLTWEGSGEVALYAVAGNDAVDISQLVIAEGEAWVPSALGLYDSATCFVVRPAHLGDEPVSVAADVLSSQGAARVCANETSTK